MDSEAATGSVQQEHKTITEAHSSIFEMTRICVGQRSSLYVHRNDSFIDRLPYEIHSHIFELTLESWPWSYQAGEASRTFSLVSRHWRDVALNTPRLWSQIDSSFHNYSIQFVDLVLTRSNPRPLDIEIGDCTCKSETGDRESCVLSKPLTTQAHRWRTVAMINAPEVEMFTAFPAPLLEKFDYKLTRHFPRTLPANIFAGHTPRLREIHLKRVDLPLTSPIYIGLTSLHLAEFRSHSSVQQLLAIIRSCPLLEQLVLDDVRLWGSQDEVCVTNPSFELARLQFIDLSCKRDISRDILAAVVIPPSAHLCLQLGHHLVDEFDGFVVKNLHNLPQIRHMGIIFDPPHCDITGRVSHSGSAQELLTLFTSGDLSEVTHKIAQLLTFSSINTLIVTDITTHSELTTYRKFLAPFMAVSILKLHPCPPILLESLASDAAMLVCPQLVELQITGTALVPHPLIHMIRSRARIIPRADSEVSLRRLTLESCTGLDPETMLELHKYVQVTVVDDTAHTA
ncbi:hypothetical protein BOTBODRAFT_511425 [Botryobasidium botryosum FD-172 SS1]|uniref:Uncharacterized protein n=1 Tax=Botryobasidium botryosum (strain FD-172 SS1) TaxID=930990 RepID=A0A067N3S1_BOTB1|nr:hypothetical protein BOTBODRAFT_511425 [Botryobasidium botryosum FD-172 SS1]